MDRLSPMLRFTLIGFAGLALIAGGLLFIGASETEDWFSWTIEPPLTAAALGAFYWGAFVLFATAVRAPGWRAARPIVLSVLVIGVALLVITLVHLDRFDMDSLFGVFWLCAYIAAPPLLIAGIVLERRRADRSGGGQELSSAFRAVLAAESAVMLGLSAVMLFAPDAAADFWPWALTPLTSRALGSFVLAVALVALIVARDGRMVLFAGTAAALVTLAALQLLAVALHSGDLGDDGLATGVYLGFVAVVAATGIYALSSAASASSRS